MQPRAVIEPPGIQGTTVQLRADPAVGQHRPRGAPLGERDHHSGAARENGPDEIDPAAGQLGGDKAAGHVTGLRGHQPGPAAQRADPGGHVGRLPANADRGHGRGVGLLGERLGQPHDNVNMSIAENADHRARRGVQRARREITATPPLPPGPSPVHMNAA